MVSLRTYDCTLISDRSRSPRRAESRGRRNRSREDDLRRRRDSSDDRDDREGRRSVDRDRGRTPERKRRRTATPSPTPMTGTDSRARSPSISRSRSTSSSPDPFAGMNPDVVFRTVTQPAPMPEADWGLPPAEDPEKADEALKVCISSYFIQPLTLCQIRRTVSPTPAS